MSNTKDLPELALNHPHKRDDIGIIKQVRIQVDVTKLTGSTTKQSINPVKADEDKLSTD